MAKVMACLHLNGVVYARHTFEKAGDVFPMHAHPPHYADEIHTTIVAKGSLRVTGARDGLVIKAGDFLHWEVDELHGLVALEDDSVIFNCRAVTERDRPCSNMINQPPRPE